MAAWHMVGISAMLAPAISALMAGHPFALMEDLDCSLGEPGFNFGSDQCVGNRIIKAMKLDMIIKPNTGHLPFGKEIIFGG